MPKFYGSIGYAISKETTPGVWVEDIVGANRIDLACLMEIEFVSLS